MAENILIFLLKFLTERTIFLGVQLAKIIDCSAHCGLMTAFDDGAKTVYQGCFYSVPFVCHRGAYSVLLTRDNSWKLTPVKQVAVAAIVILSNIYRHGANMGPTWDRQDPGGAHWCWPHEPCYLSNASMLLTEPLGTNFSAIWTVEVQWRSFCLGLNGLNHWGRVTHTHICVGEHLNIGAYNGLAPFRRQVIVGNNAGLFSIGPLRINFGAICVVRKILAKLSRPHYVKVSSRTDSFTVSIPREPYAVAQGPNNDHTDRVNSSSAHKVRNEQCAYGFKLLVIWLYRCQTGLK